MFRKLWLGIGSMLVVALIAGSSMTSVAFAQGKTDTHVKETSTMGLAILSSYGAPAAQRSDYGQILDVSRDQFAIRTSDGQELYFRFDANTRFVDSQNQAANESGLQVGKWVKVVATHVDRSWWDGIIDRMGPDAGMASLRTVRAEKLMTRKVGMDSDDSSIALTVMFSAAPAAASAPAAP